MLECMKGRQEFESSGLEEMFDDIGCEIGRNIDARMKGRNQVFFDKSSCFVFSLRTLEHWWNLSGIKLCQHRVNVDADVENKGSLSLFEFESRSFLNATTRGLDLVLTRS